MKQFKSCSIASTALVLPASLAQAHHEAASAVTGQGVFLAVAIIAIGVCVYLLQPRL